MNDYNSSSSSSSTRRMHRSASTTARRIATVTLAITVAACCCISSVQGRAITAAQQHRRRLSSRRDYAAVAYPAASLLEEEREGLSSLSSSSSSLSSHYRFLMSKKNKKRTSREPRSERGNKEKKAKKTRDKEPKAKKKRDGKKSTKKPMSGSMMGKGKKSQVSPAPTTATASPGPTTVVPTTSAPTVPGATPVPTTLAPTIPGATPSPTTAAPTTLVPGTTPVPTTSVPTVTGATAAPTTDSPTTGAPTTAVPGTTPAPTTSVPTVSQDTTPSPTTSAPTITDPQTCQDNPQDYIVNLDIQINYENDEFAACIESEENDITAQISDALNVNFPTTVPDWDGDATFGTFAFDFSQEINNLEPQLRRQLLLSTPQQVQQRRLQTTCPTRNVDCTTSDVCRWGCVTAATTDCGTSSLSNWVLLAGDVQTRLQGLGYDCLGIADELTVVVVVDDPFAGVGEAVRMGGGGGGAITSGVGTGEVGERNAALTASASVTRDAEETADGGDETHTTAERSGNNGSGCTENAVTYDVMVDLQLDFTGSNEATCSPGHQNQINTAITSTMNSKFATEVPDWDGDVGFGSVSFDDTQQVTNRRRQLLRGLVKEEHVGHRRLEECPTRIIPCELSVCHWGCLPAYTTNCGISSLTNWAILAQDVQDELSTKNLACLGNRDNLKVNILVEDPTLGTGSANRGQGGGGGPFMAPPAEDTASDISTRVLDVHSTMIFTFFQGTGELPTEDEVSRMRDAVMEFFTMEFGTRFGDAFENFEMDHIVTDYVESMPDKFQAKFEAKVTVDAESRFQETDAANVMSKAKFKELIRDYLRQSQQSEFYETYKVYFKGVTRAHHGQ